MKLKGKFTVMFIAFALIPVILAGSIIVATINKANMEEAKSTLENQERASKEAMADVISLVNKIAEDIATRNDINNYLNGINSGNEDVNLKNKIKARFKNDVERYVVYDDLIVVDKNGVAKIVALGTSEGKDLSQLDYVTKLKETKKFQISKVKKSMGTEKPVFCSAVPILDDKNEIKGMLIATVSLSKLSEEYIKNVKIGNTGYMYIVEKDGTIIAHPKNEEILTQNFTKIDISKKILEAKKGIEEYNSNGVKNLIAYDTDEQLGWTYIATIPIEELTAISSAAIKVLIIIIAIAVIVSLILSIFISKGISRPIIKVSDAMDNISEGDFTASVAVKGKDEIAHMAGKINVTMDRLRGSIGGVKNTAQEVGNSAGILKSTAEQMVTSSNEVATAIQEVAKGATEQASELIEIVNGLNDFTEELKAVEYKLANVSDKTNEAQYKAEEGKEQIDTLAESIKQIKESFEVFVNKVSGLSDTVSKIGNITDVINGISEQTNLLALNAAIEAARAGEQGRGFAVVAEEVRKLAEESKNSSEEILNLVKAISVETNDVIDTTGEVKKLLNEQEVIAGDTIKSFENIITSVEDIAPLMEETDNSLKHVEGSKDAVVNKVQGVSAVSEEVSASAQEIAASSEELLASSEEVAQLAVNVDIASENLKDKVDIFKV